MLLKFKSFLFNLDSKIHVNMITLLAFSSIHKATKSPSYVENIISPLIPTSKNLSGMVVMRLSVRASFSTEEKNRRWWFLVSER